ncbi:MAG: hypothetical protein OXU77_05680 [Gammaproteobacteria bacterium]|nr:hypothetical protein [Gammaproteobacteria bacterium]MDE0440985.1 hypothetical protein [Gammaproteobacteria bacterium]
MNIDRAQYKQLRRLARDNDVSVAWIARRALRIFLANPDPALDLQGMPTAHASNGEPRP